MSGDTVFHAELPVGWRPLVGPQVVVVARPPDEAVRGGVATHVLVARDRVPAGVTLDELADRSTAAVARRGNDVATIARGSHRNEGLERCIRVLTYASAPQGIEVAQVLALVAPVGGSELAQVVGTCALDELPRYGPAFTAVIESITAREAGLREAAADVID
jgi:hypothetical protein